MKNKLTGKNSNLSRNKQPRDRNVAYDPTQLWEGRLNASGVSYDWRVHRCIRHKHKIWIKAGTRKENTSPVRRDRIIPLPLQLMMMERSWRETDTDETDLTMSAFYYSRHDNHGHHHWTLTDSLIIPEELSSPLTNRIRSDKYDWHNINIKMSHARRVV